MAKVLNGLILVCVILLGMPGRASARETGMPDSADQAMARLSPQASASWDLQREFGSSFSVTPVYKPTDPRGTIKLMDDGIQHDALDFSFKNSLPAGLRGEGQFASTSANSQTEKWFRQYRNQLARFRMTGSSGSLEYGGEYRSVGPGFRGALGTNWRLDQEGSESWISQTVGPFKIKGMFSEFHDNLEEDPHRPRNMRMQGGSALSLDLPGRTTLSVSYQRGTLQTVGGPSRLMEDNTVNTYGASVYSWHPAWTASIATEFSQATNVADSSRQTNLFYHAASATLRPTENLWIGPTISLMQEQHTWTGGQTLTPMAMLWVSFTAPSKLFSLSSYAYYSHSKTNDGSYDVRTMNAITSLEIPLTSNTSISFDVLFYQYKDTVYNTNSYQETLGRVMYRLFAF
jgi:hypothetical protein